MSLLLLASLAAAASVDRATPGPDGQGGTVVATRQLLHPAGSSVSSGSRAIDLVLSPDGRTAYVKMDWNLLVIDTATWKVRQDVGYNEEGASTHGIAAAADGSRIWLTNTGLKLTEGLVGRKGEVTWGRSIDLPGAEGRYYSHPCGLALAADGKTAWVCLSMNNTLAVVDLEAGEVRGQIPVGVAPTDVVVSADGRTAWVANAGGPRAKRGDRTAKSAGTDVPVDARGIVAAGSVSVVDLTRTREAAQVATGLHPADLALGPDGARLYVANANADTVSVIDTAKRKVVETVEVRPDPGLPFGSAPNGLAVTPDGGTLLVANGGNNAVAVVRLSRSAGGAARVEGFIPTGWYPGAVATDGRSVYVANVKGLGSRNAATKRKEAKKGKTGWYVWWLEGTVQKVALPDATALAAHTARVRADARVPEALAAVARAEPGTTPVPVPARQGERSVFEHIVYVIKENRTYDQVFGDIRTANGDPAMCLYGRKVTPNHHALAEEFVVLDNYYCNGVVSADGHAWAVEGNVAAYLEKAGGNWTRGYDYGTDPLSYSSSGFLWENVLAHGLTFRNYGELDFPETDPPKATFAQVWAGFTGKSPRTAFTQRVEIETLKRYTSTAYPGWQMRIPDVMRAEAFLKEFKEFEAKGSWPNLVIVYLPQDHTSGAQAGMPTPNAHVADNDLALGRIVEAVSKSRFWPTTCIYVNEDDPQDGFDHVDGHRSLCLVVSPYSRLKKTVSAFYNQTSVLHTLQRQLGLPPLNQMDALAPLMTACFGARPDLTPYAARPANVPLDELNPDKKALAPAERRWVSLSDRQDFTHQDRADEDALNRILWHAAKGDAPYPVAFAGAHGRGLAALGLALVGGEVDDD